MIGINEQCEMCRHLNKDYGGGRRYSDYKHSEQKMMGVGNEESD